VNKNNWANLPVGKAKQQFVKWALSKGISLKKAKQMANSKFGEASSYQRMMNDYSNETFK
jgi:hypothetical protein